MAIKWSAVKVSQAMDEAEAQLDLAKSFLDEALAKVQGVRSLPNLADYVEQRLSRLHYSIKEGFERMKTGVESVRNSIPEGAIEAEKKATRHGTKQPLI